jgi:hypothetical protein
MDTTSQMLKQIHFYKNVDSSSIFITLLIVAFGIILQANQQTFLSVGRHTGLLSLIVAASIPLGCSFIIFKVWKIFSCPQNIIFDTKASLILRTKKPDIAFSEIRACLLTLKKDRYDVEIILHDGRIISSNYMYQCDLSYSELNDRSKSMEQNITIQLQSI